MACEDKMEGPPDPYHPIIDNPWHYRIAALSCVFPEDGSESYLDLTLVRGEVQRRLRFWSPRDIEIERGFPSQSLGMVIYDVRGRQLDGLGVWVDDDEAGWGKVTFWARAVVDLDEGPIAHRGIERP